jgi:hypothetical protein
MGRAILAIACFAFCRPVLVIDETHAPVTVNRRRQLITFLAISASNLDQTQHMNVTINPSNTPQRVVNLERWSLIKGARRFTVVSPIEYTKSSHRYFDDEESGKNPKRSVKSAPQKSQESV